MIKTDIKILFKPRREEDVITWENHVNEIIDGIENGTNRIFKVYMSNPMPIKEMEYSVNELCVYIEHHFNAVTKYYRSEECVASGSSDLLNSATYIIAFDER